MSSRPIRFVHRGRIVSVPGEKPTRTLLEWLREDARCTGTKEGCAEGDCGACTVLLAGLSEDPGAPAGVSVKPVNACLQFLGSMDGMAVITVEDLGQPQALHPAQQAMVECHGSQCGFCTPGFVASLADSYERHCAAGTVPTRQQLADDLAGNLCRCTGYRPILEAGRRMFELPPARLDRAPIAELLRRLAEDHPLALQDAEGRFFAPRSLAEFARLRQEHPQARLLAGATDIALWVNKQLKSLGDVLYIGRVAELDRIDRSADVLRIGAAVSLEKAWSALSDPFPELRTMWKRFASPPVRHAGTLAGNLANGSPIGDSAPVLMALDASLVLRRGEDVREMPLEAFYLGYMKNALQPGEFIEAVHVPLQPEGTRLRAWKVSKRYDSDISAVACGLALRLEGENVAHARFAFGGLAAVVKRASEAEAAVIGRPWNEETVAAAVSALGRDFQPLTDLRASAGYRLQVAGQLLRRFWLATRPQAPLADGELEVWAAAGAEE